jgi:hypothetical protein
VCLLGGRQFTERKLYPFQARDDSQVLTQTAQEGLRRHVIEIGHGQRRAQLAV